uniref:Uncharacterized protein n=1 Tax=Oryza barthii TaxID=65489 RepID=A0A0D3GHJ5_9ORYZ
MPPPATARGARSAASSTPLGAAGGGRRGPLPDPLAHPLPTPLPTSPATPSAPTSGLLHPLAPARRPRAASGAPDRVVHALLLLLLEPAGPKPFAPTATRSVRSHFAALPSGSSLPTSPAVADALSPDTLYFPVVQKTVSDRNAHVWAVHDSIGKEVGDYGCEKRPGSSGLAPQGGGLDDLGSKPHPF